MDQSESAKTTSLQKQTQLVPVKQRKRSEGQADRYMNLSHFIILL